MGNLEGENAEGEAAAAHCCLINRVMPVKNSIRETGWWCSLICSLLIITNLLSTCMPQCLNFDAMNACLPILTPWLYIFPFTAHLLPFRRKGGGKGKNNWIINSFPCEAFGRLRITGGKDKAAERELMGSNTGEKAHLSHAMASGSAGISGKVLHRGVERQGDGQMHWVYLQYLYHTDALALSIT